MKKFFLFLMTAVVAVSAYAGSFSFSGGTMYFDNSQTQWSAGKMMLIIGHDSYGAVYEMTASTEEAGMWYVELPASWDGANYMAVINHSGWDSGDFGYATVEQYATHYSAKFTDGLNSQSGKEYLFTPQSNANGCTLVLSEKSVEPEPEPEPTPETHWYLKGTFNEWGEDNELVAKVSGEEGKLYTTLSNLPADATYRFKIYSETGSSGSWYGNGGTMTSTNCTGWKFDADQDCQITTLIAGDYEFVWDSATITLSVIYPEPEPEIDPALLVDWYVAGNFIDNDWSNPKQMHKKDGGAENTIYASWALPAGKEYVFKLHHGTGEWFGNGGMMTQANHTNWVFDANQNCALITTIGGAYEFALDTIEHSVSVSYPENAKQATLYASPVKENNPDVMLQAFYWAHVGNTSEDYTEFGDVRWAALNEEAAEIAENFDLVWLAPSSETADFTGYLPINLSNQGKVAGNTEGHSPWGTASDLRNLIDNLHKGGAKVVADIVLNHSSASHPDEYGGPNYNWCHWNTFDFGRYGQFHPDYTWIAQGDEAFWSKRSEYGNDFYGKSNDEMNELLKNNETDEWEVSYKGGTYTWAESESNCMYSRDWSHKKKEVREMSRAFLTWMRDSIGYDGFRYDFMKGFHGSHLFDYNSASAPYFSVAELFDGDIDKQLGYLYDANYSTYVFDFPGKFTIYDAAIREYNLKNLKGNGYTLIYDAANKKYAVTFCDNHDSFHEEGKSLNYHANTIDDRQAQQALAYLLSMPGVPCVFYPYWHNYKEICKASIYARRAAGVHSQSAVVEDYAGSGAEGDNYYTAKIEGTDGNYLFLKLGYDCRPNDAPMASLPEGKVWVKAWATDNAGVWYSVDESIFTGMEQTETTNEVKKIIRNGVLYIQRGEQLFTIQGQPIQ